MRIPPRLMVLALSGIFGAGAGNVLPGITTLLFGERTISTAGMLLGTGLGCAAGLLLGEALYRKRLDFEHHANNAGRTTAILLRLGGDLHVYAASVWPRIPGSVDREEEKARRRAVMDYFEREPMPDEMRDLAQKVLNAIDRRAYEAYATAVVDHELAMLQHTRNPSLLRMVRDVLRPVRRPRRARSRA